MPVGGDGCPGEEDLVEGVEASVFGGAGQWVVESVVAELSPPCFDVAFHFGLHGEFEDLRHLRSCERVTACGVDFEVAVVVAHGRGAEPILAEQGVDQRRLADSRRTDQGDR